MNSTTTRLFVLPEALKAHRNHLAMSQAELADRSGVSLAFVGLIETGQRQPGWHNAAAIAEVLGVTVEAFAIVVADDNPTFTRLCKAIGNTEAAA